MGKIDVELLRYLDSRQKAVLSALESLMRKRDIVPEALVAQYAKIKGGGVFKILRDLSSRKLVCYERGRKYDGYRLTNLGFDYLALKTLSNKDIISGFGPQIGVGKESNVYTVINSSEDYLCLKLHRLGRTCFRSVKNNRDYLRNKNSANWLHLSRISAAKEYAYLKALHSRKFPVPEPFAHNRHCVVMRLIDGTTLNNVAEVPNVEALYDDLMNLITQLASYGVIHGDFNEFNIMITNEDAKPIIYDLPQMVSTSHPNAKDLFERDVECIRTFFRRRFNYESELYPKFAECERVEDLDKEIYLSGFSKRNDMDLQRELGLMENEESEAEESESVYDVGSDEEEIVNEDAIDKGKLHFEFVSNKSAKLQEEVQKHEEEEEVVDNFESCNSSDEDVPELDEPKKQFSPVNSIRSTTTSVAPEEIKRRVKNEFKRRELKEVRRRCVAKGEANAVTRKRRDNYYNIKDSTSGGIWGYD